ncbi:3-O-alpha-D-mannopyranosyl-alpha-D-mannopyranose xylosylphosphotransferase [Trametes pubescens]|uniref:3-O-alpha-D-mannopyranosyl-alpha-D-mannopyranose xylosylphosphotransferase n=1 Tax=Trametes pubescens TaxID=154538 RepID=A0A1M2W2Z2_TRAPU|nr:3-O-alpha-D-mannopyranosyl-alpha-D-mannopyranose xylosylphosphotransferase [Trametes pubescens]
MSSATYIPLTQISPQEFAWPPSRRPSPASLRAHLTRRRAIYVLIATTSVLTFLLFLRLSPHHDDLDDDFEYSEDIGTHNAYIAIPVPEALPSATYPKLRPVRDLPAHCLDAYYAAGQLCHDSYGPIPMDVLWTWVNGSDPLFADARERAIKSFKPDDPYRPLKKNNPSRMFRDHDELRHSIRSVLANFRPYTKRFRILTSDFFYPEKGTTTQSFPDPGAGYWRLGLQPQWLETADHATQWQDGNIQLSLTHHAHFFDPYNDTIFNSYAIETQFSHLQDVTESFIYMNDDFYMMASLTPVSFYTSPYGIVMRLQEGLQVGPDRPGRGVEGEWRSMGESNWLLSNRFGARSRPYVVHEAKATSFAILQEIALVWPDALAKTATHAFRETAAGDGDFYQMFIHAHYIVERAREALLWTWVVGRLGGLDDSWGDEESARAWHELGGQEDKEMHVEAYPRETLHPERVTANLKEAGYDTNVRTEYIFSSLDGYAYGHYDRKGRSGFPSYTLDDARPQCTIKREECFNVKGADGGAPRASDVFKHIAFERPECGDCAMLALVKASGPLGLAAFLPPEDRRVHIEDPTPTPDGFIPHLPLVDDWHDGKFALRDVLKEAHTTNIRDWSLMLLQRYRYVIGETPSSFERLLNYAQVRNTLAAVDKKKDLALLCVNDDVGKDDARVATLFYDWQEKKWPRPAAWESDVS